MPKHPLLPLLSFLMLTACQEKAPNLEEGLTLWPQQNNTQLAFYNDKGNGVFSVPRSTLDERFTLTQKGEHLHMSLKDNPWAGIQFTLPEAVDLSPYREQGVVALEVNVEASSELSMEVQLGCGEGCLRRRELHSEFVDLEGQGWQPVRIPFSCFAREGDEFDSVAQPLALAMGGSGELSLRSARMLPAGEANIQCTDYDKLAVTPATLNPHWARPWWLPRHEEKKAIAAQEEIQLVFLGDSITQGWEKEGRAVWQERYAPRGALNLGFGGDRTENVLWRLQQGAVDKMAPKALVLMIGTNNTGHRQDAAEVTAAGVKAILDELKARLPDTRILLLGIFPRGAEADDPLRQLNADINRLIEQFADGEQVVYRNINRVFLDDEGRLSSDIMPDYLHPNEVGYRLWADAMDKEIEQLMQ
ncbi:GDSL-type esterase/lipase family protein [Gilvimarinus algae]|uniref:GDSL-type esterase/lipase family protein n=1 Tax=Gilvimarinus algae TaxID=3058037 RepID=A0ABT8TCX2_9GAMM|nr:GDSL-type esterase/lipase family protein [Gilvimarinus sp. SDUM040014]MDO3381233.1 GDSL-type esterase/lipase family protein [Gilvimarinus sp. SDUM040014]